MTMYLYRRKGEFVSIIGPSGSGKSTLLHILAGIDRPTSGKVYVDGEDIYAKSEKELAYYRRRKAGLIYQTVRKLRKALKNCVKSDIINI